MADKEIKITTLTEQQREVLKSKTPFILPDNPSQKGYSASQIKKTMYEPVLLLFDWLKRQGLETKEAFEYLNNYIFEKGNALSEDIENSKKYAKDLVDNLALTVDGNLTESKNYTDLEIDKVELDYNNKFTNVTKDVNEKHQAVTKRLDEHDIDIETLDNKINSSATEQKAYTDTKVNELRLSTNEAIEDIYSSISNIGTASFEIVDSVEEVTESNVIYLIKDEEATGNDIYKEYILIDEVATLIGDTSVNLSPYITAEQIAEIYATKEDVTEEIDGKIGDIYNEIPDGSITPEKTSFVEIYENLFDKDNLVVGAVLKDNGIYDASYNTWLSTKYIPIKKNTNYYFSVDGELSNYFSTYAIYDSNFNYVKGGGDETTVFNSNVDGFIRFSTGKGEFKEKTQFQANAITEYYSYGKHIILDRVNITEKLNHIKIYENLFDKDGLMPGAIMKTDGAYYDDFAGWYATDYIPIKKDINYYFGVDGSLNSAFSTYAIYDSNKVFIKGGGNETNTFTSNVDGFIRFSRGKAFEQKTQFQANAITEYCPYGEHLIIETTKPYQNKKVLILGDSITAFGIQDTGWCKYFNEIVKPSKYVNVAVSGATWRDKEGTTYDGNPVGSNSVNNVIGNQIQKIINNKTSKNADYNNFDVIIIAAGTNDGTYETINETPSDIESQFYVDGTKVDIANVNRHTFAGAMRYAYEKLYELYPNATIFISLPIQEANENYDSIKNKGMLMKEISNRLSIPYINTFECGISNLYEVKNGAGRDLSDGIHPNSNGAKKIGTYIARYIVNWFNN